MKTSESLKGWGYAYDYISRSTFWNFLFIEVMINMDAEKMAGGYCKIYKVQVFT